MTRPPISSQSPVEKYGPKKDNDEVPLWERPEILAKYPVKAKKNPDGSYDYSDPRFENADLCEDAPPGYWESRGFIKKTSSKDEFLHFNDCLLRETNETQSLLVDFGTDKRSREEVPGKRVENENPTTFTRWGRIVGDPHCVVYVDHAMRISYYPSPTCKGCRILVLNPFTWYFFSTSFVGAEIHQ